jgi:hypothetical protein
MKPTIPPSEAMPEVPGIDDCDHLFSVSSRDGDESIYIRCQEFEWEGGTYYATAGTWDSDTAHAVDSYPVPAYAETLKQAATWAVEAGRDKFGSGNFVKCSDTRKLCPR